MASAQQVKVIGSNGQLSLGKEFAGQMVLVDQIDDGTWLIKAGQFVPTTEKWLHQPDHLSKLNQALTWNENNKPQDNFEAIVEKLDRV